MDKSFDYRSRLSVKTQVIGVLFLLPTFIVMCYTTFIPGIWNLLMSFQDGISLTSLKWAGLVNYKRLFTDNEFYLSLWNNFVLAVIATVVAVLLGTFLSISIHRMRHVEASIYRLIGFIPFMLPTAIVGLLFCFVYSPDLGLLNSFLKSIGAEALTRSWLGDPTINLYAICVVAIWKVTGLSIILCSAALQSIPASFYEACVIDGGRYRQYVWHIIIPLIKPIISIAVTFTLLLNFKAFDIVYVLTRGGPANSSQVIPIYVYKSAFGFDEYGYAAAMGIVMLFFILVVNVISGKLLRGDTHEY